MAKKEKAAPKAKTFQVVVYQATEKVNLEKNKHYLEAKTKAGEPNNGYAPVIIRLLTKGPATAAAVIAECEAKATHGAKANVEANVRWYLNDLSKRGIIKSVDTKVEATSSAEARGVEA